jgi:hypothetical protein
MRIRVRLCPEVMDERKEVAEHPFGTLKRAFGASYLLLKGLRKVGGEVGLLMIAYNFRRAQTFLELRSLCRRLLTYRKVERKEKRAAENFINDQAIQTSKHSFVNLTQSLTSTYLGKYSANPMIQKIRNIKLITVDLYHCPVGCFFSDSSLDFSSFTCVSMSLISCSILAFSSPSAFLLCSSASISSWGTGVTVEGSFEYAGFAHHHRGRFGNRAHTAGSPPHPLP